jgi:hypothetical protein
MKFYEYPCGCVAQSRILGEWTLMYICAKHAAPPPLEDLLPTRGAINGRGEQ